MTTQEKLEVIRQACIKANPEIEKRVNEEALEYAYWFRLHKSWSDEEVIEYVDRVVPKIRLADVLLAIN